MYSHKTLRVNWVSGLLVCTLLTPWTALAGSPGYVFQTVDPPFGEPGVDINIQIIWINNSGVITAQFQSPPDPNGLANMHTALLRAGQWTLLDVPGASTTGGTNANNQGQTVLTYQFADGVWHAATYDRGQLDPFPDIPGYPGGLVVQGLNDRGQIAASVYDADGVSHGFVGDAENYTIFDYPDPEVTLNVLFMLNNAATSVGTYFLSDGTRHGYKLEDSEFTNINPPGSLGADATAINNRGAIAGVMRNENGEFFTYVLEHGQYAYVQFPGAFIAAPYSINDRGQLSGVYLDSNTMVAHGFVATPVPTTD